MGKNWLLSLVSSGPVFAENWVQLNGFNRKDQRPGEDIDMAGTLGSLARTWGGAALPRRLEHTELDRKFARLKGSK